MTYYVTANTSSEEIGNSLSCLRSVKASVEIVGIYLFRCISLMMRRKWQGCKVFDQRMHQIFLVLRFFEEWVLEKLTRCWTFRWFFLVSWEQSGKNSSIFFIMATPYISATQLINRKQKKQTATYKTQPVWKSIEILFCNGRTEVDEMIFKQLDFYTRRVLKMSKQTDIFLCLPAGNLWLRDENFFHKLCTDLSFLNLCLNLADHFAALTSKPKSVSFNNLVFVLQKRDHVI